MILRLATAIAAIATATCLSAQEPVDTVLAAPKAKEVTIIEKGDGITVLVKGYNDTEDGELIYRTNSGPSASFPVMFNDLPAMFGGRKDSTSCSNRWNAIFSGIYLGFNNGMDTDMDIDFGRSTEFGILNLVAAEYRPWRYGPRFSLGLGLGWKNYVTKKGRDRFYKSSDGKLVSAPYPDGTIGFRSTLRIFHLDVPFLIKQTIDRHWAISVGGIVNFNVDARASSRYRTIEGNPDLMIASGKSVTEKYNHLKQRLVTAELMFAIGYNNALALYMKYSPMTVMKDGEGPRLKSWSLGVMFPF